MSFIQTDDIITAIQLLCTVVHYKLQNKHQKCLSFHTSLVFRASVAGVSFCEAKVSLCSIFDVLTMKIMCCVGFESI